MNIHSMDGVYFASGAHTNIWFILSDHLCKINETKQIAINNNGWICVTYTVSMVQNRQLEFRKNMNDLE